jgi:hypothetical protein
MRLVEIKESIHNTVITLITVARLYDKFLVWNGEGYAKLFQFTEKTSNLMKNVIYLFKKILAADFFDTMNFWLINFDGIIVKWWSFVDLNENPTFEFFTYPFVVTKIITGFDQDIFIEADNYKIILTDVIRNREKTLYHSHTNLIFGISVFKRYDRWASLQWNGDVYIWIHNVSTQETIKLSRISHDLVSRFPKLIQKMKKNFMEQLN